MSLARKIATMLVSSGATVDPRLGGAPAGVVLPFAGTAEPSGWLLCYGQAVSRSTYEALFAAIGTTYGGGDGSTTFNLPDLRGRVAAGKDDMGGVAAGRLTSGGSGVNGVVLGSGGGAETHTLTLAQTPAHSHTVSGATARLAAGPTTCVRLATRQGLRQPRTAKAAAPPTTTPSQRWC